MKKIWVLKQPYNFKLTSHKHLLITIKNKLGGHHLNCTKTNNEGTKQNPDEKLRIQNYPCGVITKDKILVSNKKDPPGKLKWEIFKLVVLLRSWKPNKDYGITSD